MTEKEKHTLKIWFFDLFIVPLQRKQKTNI